MTPQKETYAPSQPFAEAIVEWTRYHGSHHGHDHNHKGIEVLAVRARIPARSLRGYVSGERQVISLTNADRLSIALGVALSTLAKDFGTKRQALERSHLERPAA